MTMMMKLTERAHCQVFQVPEEINNMEEAKDPKVMGKDINNKMLMNTSRIYKEAGQEQVVVMIATTQVISQVI